MSHSPKHDLTGVAFGNLTATRATSKRYKGYILWECICSCGKTMFYDCSRLMSGRVKSCGCLKTRQSYTHPNFKGFGSVPLKYFSSVRHSSIRRGLDFDLTIEYISDLLEKQKFKCALSGLPIYLKNKKDKTASLDRIDSSKGYVVGNVQWLHKKVNNLKSDYSDYEFVVLCGKIWENGSALLASRRPKYAPLPACSCRSGEDTCPACDLVKNPQSVEILRATRGL